MGEESIDVLIKRARSTFPDNRDYGRKQAERDVSPPLMNVSTEVRFTSTSTVLTPVSTRAGLWFKPTFPR